MRWRPSLEVGTTPLITASPSFTYKVDPATGLRVRQATTFGPSFSERALTSGEGKVALYASVTAASYEQLGDFSLERMQLTNATGPTAASSRRGLASLVLQAETLLMSSSVGVTDKLDLSVGVPLVRMSVDGIAWMEDGNQNVLALAKGAGTSTGLGDMAVSGKYRLTSFGEGPPDPGGIALVATVRLPTGDKDNFRGLGITRTMVSAVVSTGKARFRPHGNVGFDFWSDGIDAITDDDGRFERHGTAPVPVRGGFRVRGGAEADAAGGSARPAHPRRRTDRHQDRDAHADEPVGPHRRDIGRVVRGARRGHQQADARAGREVEPEG